MQRTAVDRVTKEYWDEYFKEYGKQWTRNIPRRVAHALAANLKKSAAMRAEPQDIRVLKAIVTGLPRSQKAPEAPSWVETPTGGLIFEGVFRGDVVRDGKRAKIARVFKVEFGGDGTMLDLSSEAY